MKRWGGEEARGDLELGGGMALLCFAFLGLTEVWG